MDRKASNSTPVISVKVEKDSADQSLAAGQTQNTDEGTRSEHPASAEQTSLPADHVAPSSSLVPPDGQTTPSDNPVQDGVEHTYSILQRSNSGTLTLAMDPPTSDDHAESDGSQLVTCQSVTNNSNLTSVDSATDITVRTENGQYVIENDYVTLVPAGTQEQGQPLKLEDGVEITVTYDNGNFGQNTGDDDESRGIITNFIL